MNIRSTSKGKQVFVDATDAAKAIDTAVNTARSFEELQARLKEFSGFLRSMKP